MGILSEVMAIKDREEAANVALANLPNTLVQGYVNGLAIKEKQAQITDLMAQAESRKATANLDTLMKASTLKKNAKDLRDPQMFDLGNALEQTVTGAYSDYRQALDPAVAAAMPPVLGPSAVTTGPGSNAVGMDSIIPEDVKSAAEERDQFGEFTQRAKNAQKIADEMIKQKFQEEKPPTQAQETTALYASRLKQANDVFGSMENYINNQGVVGTQVNKLLPNFAKDERFQAYEQAQRNFLTAVLRRESGAVISPSEFAEGRMQYFPQPGDKPQVLAQKKANRELVMQNFQKSAGKAYVAYDENGEVKQKPDKTGEKSSLKNFVEGKVYRDANGNRARYEGGKWVPLQ